MGFKAKMVVLVIVLFVVTGIITWLMYINLNGDGVEIYSWEQNYPTLEVIDYREAPLPISPKPIEVSLEVFSRDLILEDKYCFVDVKVDDSGVVSLIFWAEFDEDNEKVIFKTETRKELTEIIDIPDWKRPFRKISNIYPQMGGGKVYISFVSVLDEKDFFTLIASIFVCFGIAFSFLIFAKTIES